jgi:hypothetical protein
MLEGIERVLLQGFQHSPRAKVSWPSHCQLFVLLGFGNMSATAEGYPVFPLKGISVCRTAYIESNTKDFDSGVFARRGNIVQQIENAPVGKRRISCFSGVAAENRRGDRSRRSSSAS